MSNDSPTAHPDASEATRCVQEISRTDWHTASGPGLANLNNLKSPGSAFLFSVPQVPGESAALDAHVLQQGHVHRCQLWELSPRGRSASTPNRRLVHLTRSRMAVGALWALAPCMQDLRATSASVCVPRNGCALVCQHMRESTPDSARLAVARGIMFVLDPLTDPMTDCASVPPPPSLSPNLLCTLAPLG